jgi:hypothetical protein
MYYFQQCSIPAMRGEFCPESCRYRSFEARTLCKDCFCRRTRARSTDLFARDLPWPSCCLLRCAGRQKCCASQSQHSCSICARCAGVARNCILGCSQPSVPQQLWHECSGTTCHILTDCLTHAHTSSPWSFECMWGCCFKWGHIARESLDLLPWVSVLLPFCSCQSSQSHLGR